MPDHPDTYITAVPVADMFVDREAGYQRECDTNRANGIARTWAPRLVGVLDVSDRGENAPAGQRYAIINGQHRHAAALLVDATMSLPVTVHTGLTTADEAQLFWDIDRKTKKLTNWDRWYARRAAGVQTVAVIDAVAAKYGYVVSHNPSRDGVPALQCCSALEFVYTEFEERTLDQLLELIGDIWPGDPEARKSNIIKGLGRILFENAAEIDTGRLCDALSAMTPTQLVARAHELKAKGWSGGVPRLCGTAALMAYNRAGKTKIRLDAGEAA